MAISGQAPSEEPRPWVFISYAREDDGYIHLVKRLAKRLRSDGVNAHLDEWHCGGRTITEFMSSEVRKAEKVLIVCSPQYRSKVHAMEDGEAANGVGWEAMLVTSGMFCGEFPRHKVVVVVLRGQRQSAVPDFLQGVRSIDLTDMDQFEQHYLELLRDLTGKREIVPPIGPHPVGIEPADIEPLRGTDAPPPSKQENNMARQTAKEARAPGLPTSDRPGQQWYRRLKPLVLLAACCVVLGIVLALYWPRESAPPKWNQTARDVLAQFQRVKVIGAPENMGDLECAAGRDHSTDLNVLNWRTSFNPHEVNMCRQEVSLEVRQADGENNQITVMATYRRSGRVWKFQGLTPATAEPTSQ